MSSAANSQRIADATDQTVQLKINADGSVNLSGTAAAASGTADAGNPLKVGGVFNTAQPTLTNGQRGDAQMSARAEWLVQIQNGGTPNTMQGPAADGASNAVNALVVSAYKMVFNGTTWDRFTVPNATSRIVSAAASTNATSAKASAGKVHNIVGWNAAAALRYLKLYNKASAPTVGTDTPVLTIPLQNGALFNIQFPNGGMYFSTGIAYALTVNAADSDATALTAADVLGLNIAYS